MLVTRRNKGNTTKLHDNPHTHIPADVKTSAKKNQMLRVFFQCSISCILFILFLLNRPSPTTEPLLRPPQITEPSLPSQPMTDVSNSDSPSKFPLSIIKKREGTDPNTWKLVDWDSPISPEEESKFSCDWTTFESAASGKTAQMCVHSFYDLVSDAIKKSKRFGDCDLLPILWGEEEKENSVFLDIGTNIGSCTMEMLLGTNASIISFEPHPMNLFNIKKTVSKMDKSYQDRLLLFPVGLGDAQAVSTIYSGGNNMGNSVIGKIIKDWPSQVFNETYQFDIHVERLDSILDANKEMDIKLIKMDVQGYECHTLEGMGKGIAEKIDAIKFEYAQEWLNGQDCRDLVPRMKAYDFDVFEKYNAKEFSVKVDGDIPSREGIFDLFAKKNEALVTK